MRCIRFGKSASHCVSARLKSCLFTLFIGLLCCSIASSMQLPTILEKHVESQKDMVTGTPTNGVASLEAKMKALEAKMKALEARTTAPIAAGYVQGFAGTEAPITADEVAKQKLVSETTNLKAGGSRSWIQTLILSANGNGIHDVHDNVLFQDNKRSVLPEKNGKEASSNERTKHINMGMIPVQDPGLGKAKPKSGKLGMSKSKPKKGKASGIVPDDKSAVLPEKNGKEASSGKRTKHVNIRYFFITDRVNNGEVSVAWCTTEDTIGDYATKPLQGAMFRQFRDQIMGAVPAQDPRLARTKSEPTSGKPGVAKSKPKIGETTDIVPQDSTGTEKCVVTKRVTRLGNSESGKG
jgi:hypothetical protein